MENNRYFIKKDFRTANDWLYTTDFSVGAFRRSKDIFSETDKAMYLNGGYTGLLHEWVPKNNLIEIKEDIYKKLMHLSSEFDFDDLTMGSQENASRLLNEAIQNVLNDAGIILR